MKLLLWAHSPYNFHGHFTIQPILLIIIKIYILFRGDILILEGTYWFVVDYPTKFSPSYNLLLSSLNDYLAAIFELYWSLEKAWYSGLDSVDCACFFGIAWSLEIVSRRFRVVGLAEAGYFWKTLLKPLLWIKFFLDLPIVNWDGTTLAVVLPNKDVL